MKSSNDAKYAMALYSLVNEDKQLESYLSAINEAGELFASNEDLCRFLSSYSIPKENKFPVLEKIFSSSPKHLVPFLKVLVDKHQFDHYEAIFREFRTLVNESLGIKEGLVYSVSPLSKEQLQGLEKTLGELLSTKVSLVNRLDRSLIGGIKVAIDGKVYDSSLENRLNKLTKTLLSK
ncbi:MAG: F0F1 ATP synthase subunit delta [Bacilli bacterium]|nr:F0F1 ATP synthase subunit delta [Bacilli bacterium]